MNWAQNVQERVCNVYVFQLSFRFACRRWWLGRRRLAPPPLPETLWTDFLINRVDSRLLWGVLEGGEGGRLKHLCMSLSKCFFTLLLLQRQKNDELGGKDESFSTHLHKSYCRKKTSVYFREKRGIKYHFCHDSSQFFPPFKSINPKSGHSTTTDTHTCCHTQADG